MEHRIRRRRFAILLAIIAIPATYMLREYVSLCRYQSFIHRHYAAEIRQLEVAMQEWPEDRFEDEATDQSVEVLHQQLRQTFSAGDFYCASWSLDSHHGAKSSGIPDSGFSTYQLIQTTDDAGQSLCFGKSFEGTPLLVYQRWLPDSPVMRHIQIVFHREKVSRSMTAEKPR